MTQAYTEEISRTNPLTVIFLVDQSGSMEDPFGGKEAATKAKATSDALNRLIDTMIQLNLSGEEVYNRLLVSVIGYGGNTVASALGGALAGKNVVPLSDLNDNRIRLENRRKKVPDGAGGVIEVEEPFPIWLEPKADGVTPMKQAFEKAKGIVQQALKDHPNAHPPIVINITDGAYTPTGPAGDPSPVVKEIISLQNINGSQPLVYNGHITHEQLPPILYPVTNDSIRDEYARELFAMSSPLPAATVAIARSRQFHAIQDGSKGFVYQADMVQMIEFLDIGTRAAIEFRPGQEESHPGSESTASFLDIERPSGS